MFTTPIECLDQGTCTVPAICNARKLCGITSNSGLQVTRQRFARGDRIATGIEKDDGIRFHVVREGLAATSVTLNDGRRQFTSLFVPQDLICPFGLCGAASWAEALTETETWEIFLDAAAEDACGAPDMVNALFMLCRDALELSQAHNILLGRLNGSERLCRFVSEMTRRAGRNRKEFWELSLPMSREDIADYLGLSAETVSRLFTQLKRKGLLRMQSPTVIEIPNLDALESTSNLLMPSQSLALE